MRKDDGTKNDALRSLQTDYLKTFTLKVKKPCGSIISFNATSDMTVNDLKFKIMLSTELQTTATQILHLGKRRLAGKVSLGQYNIVEEDLLTLTVRDLDPEEIISQLNDGTFEFKSCETPDENGYPYELFVNRMEITKWNAYCVICKNIPRDAMEIDCDCGGNICECCLRIKKHTTSLNGGVKVPCWTEGCQKAIDINGVRKTRVLRRMILRQIVKCNSTINSTDTKCSWIGSLGNLEEHITVCGFQSVVCPFKCKRLNLRKGEMTMEGHFSWCPGFFLKCPHCSEFFTRSELMQHQDCCPEELIPCMYDCGNKEIRRKTERHNEENMILHMWCMKKALDAETKKREQFEKKMMELKKSNTEMLAIQSQSCDLFEKEVVRLNKEHKNALDVEIQRYHLLKKEVDVLKTEHKKSIAVEIKKRKVLENDIKQLRASHAGHRKNVRLLMKWKTRLEKNAKK